MTDAVVADVRDALAGAARSAAPGAPAGEPSVGTPMAGGVWRPAIFLPIVRA